MTFQEAVKYIDDTKQWMTASDLATCRLLQALATQIEANRIAIENLEKQFLAHSHLVSGLNYNTGKPDITPYPA